ncbi:hypothetical protein Tco_1138727, partial [Tanacetum coccineum]
MATMAKNVIVAGAENRPPMLEKGMYDSWKTRIWLYIKGKENGDMLIDSIENGPFKFKKEITIPGVNGAADEKQIWDGVKELMEGTELTLQEHESKLYDEFDKFTSMPGETIHSYYWRYAKFINDININRMTMKKIQVNMKFVNHLQPEWSRFVTAAKQAKDLHSVNFGQLHAFLKHNKHDVKEVREMRQRYPDQLALLANQYNPPPSYNIRQSQGYGVNTGKSQATGTRGTNTAQEAGVILHEDQQDFLADMLEEMDDYDDLQLHNTSNFKADHVDAYDSDCDDEATACAIFMASLSPARSINGDTAGPSFDSELLYEVPHYDTYHKNVILNDVVQEMEYNDHVVFNDNSCDELTSNSNVISYADY